MLFSALIMWVQGLFLKLDFGSLVVVLILRWTTWWLRRLDVALQITKGTWWARTCWKTTWIAEIGKARIITGSCFLVFSRCFCYNFSLQNIGVLFIKKVIPYQIIIEAFQCGTTLFMNHFEAMCYTHFKVDLYKSNKYSLDFSVGSYSSELHQGICLGIRTGPSQGLKIRGARSTVVGIVCSSWLR